MRQWLSEQLAALDFTMTDSKANFVFVEHAHMGAADIAGGLRERGIIVRHLTSNPRTQNHLRISVGTQAECDVLVNALGEILV
jgi:histidinol-phosphate aminotransferase